MEKSNANLLGTIRSAAFPDALSTVTVRLSVAKNVFSLAATAYFSLYLATVGGFAPETSARFLFLFYPAFLLSAYVLLYELASFSVRVYFEKYELLRFVALGALVLLYLAGLALHFGFFHP
jgi:hypothetical protein